MRWLLVGCGVQGERWKKRLGNKCVGVVDVRPVDVDTYRFWSVQDAVKSGLDFDVALVAVSSEHHFSLSHFLLESGKHVLCEKPLCFTIQQLEKLFELSKKKNKIIGQVCLERFNPNLLSNMDDLIKLREVEFIRLGLRPDHRFGEGPVFDLGVHDIDLFLFYFYGKYVKFRFGYVDKLEDSKRTINGLDLRSPIDCMVPQILLFEDMVKQGNYIDGFEFLQFELSTLSMVRLEELKKPHENVFDLEIDGFKA